MKQLKYIPFLLVAALLSGSCKKNFTNPAATQVDEALSSSVGLTGVAIGVQKQYSVNRAAPLYNLVTANGFSTFELRLQNAGNTDEFNLSVGGINVDGNNGVIGNLWAQNLKVIFDANNVINNAANLGDQGYASGLIAYASIFKALAYGNLSMFWEQVPDTIGTDVGFTGRAQGFQKAIAAINNALSAISTNAISASFLSNLPAGMEIPNTLQALKARYLLFTGDYDGALAAANLVDLSKKSTMNFDAVSPNPIFNVSTATNNVFQVLDSTLGLPEDLAPVTTDKRIPFYMSINETVAPRWRIKGFGAALDTPWPIYVPGEITLIKAECNARKSSPSIPDAIVELDNILTKAPADDPFGIGADLDPYAGAATADAVLTEIYRQRCIELYMQGYKLEDMRRFGRSNDPNVEKRRNFFPYPFRERDNNPNTPADPAF
ncbi:MAG: RagB/SusD family nutrient uptake outer membrane protein [Chitinophagaceae bacterium]|nr:RagB/SusD family nutrient uptake outer membrane protein [Chitinophagaceae bacterium]